MKYILTTLLLSLSVLSYGQISGTAFRDFNSNGVKDNTATYNEVGLQGITVKAFDPSGAQVGSTQTTDADGEYTISGVSGDVRIEFTGLLNSDYASFNGSSNGTSVQFATAPATNVDFGVSYPQAYCGPSNDPDPQVAITCFINGQASGTDDVLVSFDWSESGQKSSNTIVKDAENGQIGSVWGTAYDRDNKKLYTGAFLKRHVEVGSGGLGAIYLTDYSGANGVTTSTPVVTISNVGTVANRDVNVAKDQPSRDPDAFIQVGKVGLGGIEISPDGSTLWAVNLASKAIVPAAISGSSGTEGTPIAIPNPGCGGNAIDWRPFALTYHREALYAGGVCSGETGGATTMRYYVYRYDLSSSTWDAQPLINESLGYTKGYAFKNECDTWNPWITNFSEIGYAESDGDFCHPQAMLSDISFDVDDDMILIFMDRFGHQTGRSNYCPDPNGNCTADGVTRTGANWSGVIGGDILRADFSPASNTFTLESAGQIGSDGCGTGGSKNDGTSVSEYYCGDWYAGGNVHFETIQGTGAVLAGSGEILTSNMDPINLVSGGMLKMNNKSGDQTDQIELYVTGFSNTGTFAKSNGLGEVDLLCENPPLEIGNRVWFDANENGVQDAGEIPLDGVEIELCAANGTTVLGTTTTANGGQWYFNNTNVNQGGASGLLPNTDYVIKVATALDDAALATYTAFTSQNSTASNGEGDLGDSDADATGTITYKTGMIGANDHSLDIGVTQATTAVCEITLTATPGTCVPATNLYEVTGELTFANAPSTGTLTVSVGGQQQVFNAPFTSPQAYTITGLNSDGASKTVTAVFSAETTCTNTATYTAPASCSLTPVCSVTLTATPGTCVPATNLYEVTGELTFANAPTTGTLTVSVDGQQQVFNAPFTSPQAYTITGLTSDGASKTVTAVFSAETTCTNTATYTAPASCTPTCVTPDAGDDVVICLPKTTVNLADAPTDTEWMAETGNPAAATIDATTGEITGLTATGVYTFRLQTTGDPTCSSTMTVTVTNGEAPNVLCNDGSTSVTLEAPANLSDVKWYSIDGTEVGTGNSLIVTSNTGGLADGTEAYYYVGVDGSASGCDVELCCPVKFITQDCCPTPNCVGVTVIKN